MPNQSRTADGTDPELVAALGLFRIGSDTIGPRLFRSMVSEPWVPTPFRADLVAPRPLPPEPRHLETLAEWLGIPRHQHSKIIQEVRGLARSALLQADREGLTLIGYQDDRYPQLLWHIPDPPIALWLRGNADVLSAPAVAIVGSRDATPMGLEAAHKIGREVAKAGLTVVSGLARGIDAAAHSGALEAGGPTIAVLGCGADVVYPSGHRSLAAGVAANGAIVSELPPGTQPFPSHFPLRNRIISGLSRGVVIVQASERSGSLITARAALEQGREVMAVPGGFASGRHRGCHQLIKDGARLVETVEDILEQVGWMRPSRIPTGDDSSRTPADPAPGDDHNPLSHNTLEHVMAAGETYWLDDLVQRTGRPVPVVLAELADLELAGKMARMAGGGFVRLD